MNNAADVSVIIPVHNGGRFLERAILSILEQSYTNILVIIINDASTDNSDQVIRSFSDSRIIYISNLKNLGLIKTLNIGLKHAIGRYIIRMDQDDICFQHRIEAQVKFMDENIDTAAAGTNIAIFYPNYPMLKINTKLPIDSEEIRCRLLFKPAIMHPTAIIRRNVVVNNGLEYDEQHRGAEDYGFWVKLLKYGRLRNMNDSYLKYRISPNTITKNENRNFEKRRQVIMCIYREVFEYCNINITDIDLNTHFEIAFARYLPRSNYTLVQKANWLLSILRNNDFLNSKVLEKELSYQFYINCIIYGTYRNYKESQFFSMKRFSYFQYLISKVKIMVRNTIE